MSACMWLDTRSRKIIVKQLDVSSLFLKSTYTDNNMWTIVKNAQLSQKRLRLTHSQEYLDINLK